MSVEVRVSDSLDSLVATEQHIVSGNEAAQIQGSDAAPNTTLKDDVQPIMATVNAFATWKHPSSRGSTRVCVT